MPHKEIIGIRITPRIVFESESVREIRFDLFIGAFAPRDNKIGAQFITNEAIRKKIEETGKTRSLKGTRLGFALANIQMKQKAIRMVSFYPLHSFLGFEKKGVGNFAEYRIEKYLESQYPGFLVLTSASHSKERIAQLRKRKRKINKPISIENAVRLTRNQVAKGIKKYRRARRK